MLKEKEIVNIYKSIFGIEINNHDKHYFVELCRNNNLNSFDLTYIFMQTLQGLENQVSNALKYHLFIIG